MNKCLLDFILYKVGYLRKRRTRLIHCSKDIWKEIADGGVTLNNGYYIQKYSYGNPFFEIGLIITRLDD